MPEITAMPKHYTKVRNVDTSSMLCSFLPHLSAQPRPGATVLHINSAYADDLQKTVPKADCVGFSTVGHSTGGGRRGAAAQKGEGEKPQILLDNCHIETVAVFQKCK